MERDHDMLRRIYDTALECGFPMVGTDTAARILAVTYVHGNNEFLTHCPKFAIESSYIQRRFGIHGSGTPDRAIIAPLRNYVAELEAYLAENPKERYPQWARDLFKERYGIKLIN